MYIQNANHKKKSTHNDDTHLLSFLYLTPFVYHIPYKLFLRTFSKKKKSKTKDA